MGNIPDQVETWITARNVQRIKAVLLDKESYDSVCSGLEPMGNAFSGMEVIFGELSSHGMLPAHCICRLREVQTNLKAVRCLWFVAGDVLLFVLP